jgi:hypothetical protein
MKKEYLYKVKLKVLLGRGELCFIHNFFTLKKH